MSLSEVERFARDLKSNPDLLASVRDGRLDEVIERASGHGYDFTFDEAKGFIQANAERAGKALSEAQLDRVTGAGCYGFCCIVAGGIHPTAP
jgi:hypothetical protein